MKTKQILSVLLMLVLCLSLFAGCGQKTTTDETNNDKTVTEDTTVADTTTEEPTTDTTASDTTDAEDTTQEDTAAEDTEEVIEETPAPVEKIDIQVAAMKGPTSMGMVQLMEQAEAGATANNYQFTLAGAADEITPQIIKGEIQIAAVPCNLASVLFNKSQGGVKVAGINVTSVLYVIETGASIHSVEDLKGKTIYSTGKGTTPEYTLNQLLLSAGIDPVNDVTIEYKSEATEVAAVLQQTPDAIGLLPQPFVTVAMSQNENLKMVLDLTAEWDKVQSGGSGLVTGVTVCRSDFLADEAAKAAVDLFLAEHKESTEFANTNVAEAAELVAAAGIIAKAPVAVKAMPYCSISYIDGLEMKEKLAGYLNVLFEQDPTSVGGKLPEDSFYYIP